MIYALVVSFVVGLLSGAGAMHQFDQGQIVRLRTAIELGNREAAQTLSAAMAKLNEAQQLARQNNEALQASYDQNLSTINAYFDRVRAKRSTSHSNPVPGCASAEPFTATAADFAETAYKLEAWAQSCWQFVANQCGIKP
jgi:hypothetical protein